MWGTPQGRLLVSQLADAFHQSFFLCTVISLYRMGLSHTTHKCRPSMSETQKVPAVFWSAHGEGDPRDGAVAVGHHPLPQTWTPAPETTILIPQSPRKAWNCIQRWILTAGIRGEQTHLWCKYLSGALIPSGFPLLMGVRHAILPRRQHCGALLSGLTYRRDFIP